VTDSWDRIQAVFFDALDRAPSERAEFLRVECADDESLRTEVLAMLAAHADESALAIESRLLVSAAGLVPATDRAGERAGPYRLIEHIGSGGMGEVYSAERDDDAFQRRVAVKIVRAGGAGLLDDRFRRERDILARLDHAHIARLYDGGTTERGASYLVMELVEGVKITEYCDRERLTIRDRLKLFRLVCDAVQAAHERLIVHRDLKPSNILVAADGTPRLLDFGIARLLDSESESGEQTRALDRWMSPEHAAPEQIRGEPSDTATDVYSLGVLLYELLTGDLPLEFSTRSPAEIERVALGEAPAPPSRRVIATAAKDDPAKTRRSDPAGLSRRLRGDLDAITLMALRKEPIRRYRTAGALADDIGRHLNGLPVRARPDTAGYRARRFVRRNGIAVAAATTIGLLIVGFAGTSAWQAGRIAAERDRAMASQASAERSMAALVRMFELTRPENLPGGDTLRVTTFLDQGARMAAALDGQGERAELFEALGTIRRERGELREASTMIDSAIACAGDERARGRLKHQRAVLVWLEQGPRAAEPLLRESLTRLKGLHGPRHADVAAAMTDLSFASNDPDEVRRLLKSALAMRMDLLPADDMAIASSLSALGADALRRAEFDEARGRFEEAAAILAKHGRAADSERLTVDHNLAALYARRGEWERAEAMNTRVLEARIRMHGAGALPVAGAWEAIGVTRANRGNLRGAAEAFSNALATFEASLPASHWRVANAARNVGQLMSLQGQFAEGLPFLDRAVAARESGGERDAGYHHMRGQRAMAWLGLGRTREAILELERVAQALAKPDARGSDLNRGDVHVWLGIAQLEAGRPETAERHFRTALDAWQGALPADHPRIAEATCGLALSTGAQGRGGEASALLGPARDTYLSWGLAQPLLRRRLERPARNL
jgi:serine/threonine-protein kinase